MKVLHGRPGNRCAPLSDCRQGEITPGLQASDRGILDRTVCLQLIKACRTLSQAKDIHERVQHMLGSDVRLCNMLVHMYGKCGSVEHARRVFDRLSLKNSFSWEMMLSAYARNGHIEEAKHVFDGMPEKHLVSRTAMLVAYARYGRVREAKNVFDEMPVRDLVSWTTMLDAYARNGHMEEARQVFDAMPETDMISWTAMLAAYAQNGYLEEAKQMFNRMPVRDLVSWTAMVSAYAGNGHLEEAKEVFAGMQERNLVSWTLMLCTYGQRGNVEEARQMFNGMPEQDNISWNSMLAAYARNGHSSDAVELFHTMMMTDMPDDISFILLLLACSHAGKVNVGRSYFGCISMDYAMKPTKQHYSCMIDLLGRAGHLSDAEDLIVSEPFEPDASDWRSLLAACTSHKDVKRAARATKLLLELAPATSSPYVMLANIIGNDEDVQKRLARTRVQKFLTEHVGLNEADSETRNSG